MSSPIFQNSYSNTVSSPSSPSSPVPQQYANTFNNPYSHNITADSQARSPDQGPDLTLSPTTRTGDHNHHTLKTFAFRGKGALSRNLEIVEIDQFDNENPAYSIVVTAWKPSKPDVTLHLGADSTGRVLGVAHFRWSGHMTLGLGDPVSEPMTMVWEEMRKPSVWKNKFTFEFTDTHDSDTEPRSPSDGPRRRHFLWQRTTDAADGVEGFAAKISLRNYRLVDHDSQEVVAVFLSGELKHIKKRGNLRIFRKLSPDLEKFVILSCASISERLARD